MKGDLSYYDRGSPSHLAGGRRGSFTNFVAWIAWRVEKNGRVEERELDDFGFKMPAPDGLWEECWVHGAVLASEGRFGRQRVVLKEAFRLWALCSSQRTREGVARRFVASKGLQRREVFERSTAAACCASD